METVPLNPCFFIEGALVCAPTYVPPVCTGDAVLICETPYRCSCVTPPIYVPPPVNIPQAAVCTVQLSYSPANLGGVTTAIPADAACAAGVEIAVAVALARLLGAR